MLLILTSPWSWASPWILKLTLQDLQVATNLVVSEVQPAGDGTQYVPTLRAVMHTPAGAILLRGAHLSAYTQVAEFAEHRFKMLGVACRLREVRSEVTGMPSLYNHSRHCRASSGGIFLLPSSAYHGAFFRYLITDFEILDFPVFAHMSRENNQFF
eukprot:gnl/MRDRNA2_/MRDRNA2_85343_c0_seq3.p1 gnl/MRDRNA2_/MRDRNA2_85343_c0~~gnl/MRDRNA2_/MRDRNA2_85343_c0_seq3.p1  ORF type:complete len:156 (+),score=18.85 gnl/MRDRNA2_/MRDRNA2_85343_c0_seq3:94-561(+)